MTPGSEEASDRLLVELSRFMSRYAAVLDRGDLEAWVSQFAPEASYRVGTIENQSSGLPMQLIDDASKSKIEDRVLIVRKYWSGGYNEYAQRHVLSLPVLNSADGDSVRMEQSFAVYVTDKNFGGSTGGRSSLLCVGRYLASFSGSGSGRRLSELHVMLDTSVMTQSLVYPI